MRNLKFRAWDDKVKKMFYPSSISWKGDYVWCCASVGNDHIYEALVDHANIMQFTGLHDKNGKEIFEGDVGRDADDETHGVVEFFGGCFMVRQQYGHWIPSEYTEVLGNIYENPELLQPKE